MDQERDIEKIIIDFILIDDLKKNLSIIISLSFTFILFFNNNKTLLLICEQQNSRQQ